MFPRSKQDNLKFDWQWTRFLIWASLKCGSSNRSKKTIVQPGTHKIEYTYDKGEHDAVLEILVDGEVVIREIRPKDWVNSSGSPSTSSIPSVSQSFDADAVLQLLHLRFSVAGKKKGTYRTPTGPSAGISIWIQAVDAPSSD